uniref:Uncharacterized protein n=1 Tax=Geospiza parvula TaxID=87175 RepID=A0A8U8B147_GEOPR
MARLLALLLLAALGCQAGPGRRRRGTMEHSVIPFPASGPLPTAAGERPGSGAGLRGWVRLLLLGAARGPSPAPPAQRPPARGCANLTLVLDNWKFAITSQLRNLLLSDHQTVLPDYGRIPALSGALDELYRDFRGLKEQLGRLSDRFAHLEASVEQLSRARGAAAPPRRGGVPQNPGGPPGPRSERPPPGPGAQTRLGVRGRAGGAQTRLGDRGRAGGAQTRRGDRGRAGGLRQAGGQGAGLGGSDQAGVQGRAGGAQTRRGDMGRAGGDRGKAWGAQPGWGTGAGLGGSDWGHHFGGVLVKWRAETSLGEAQAGGLRVITWGISR